MYHLIIFGPPGVGKGTQAALIAERLAISHFSTGDILRSAVSEKTEFGIKAKEIMDKGELVPDELMISIVKDALKNNNLGNGFILDGFPRTIAQAESLNGIFKELGFNNAKILYLTADDDEVVQRLLKRGRSDDTEDTIRHRLKVYRDSTAPVIDFYNGKSPVIEINGVGEVEDIYKTIMNAVND